VRAATFKDRSALPTSAACVVANGVRETLARVLGSEASVKLFEPVMPSPEAWAAIGRDAICFRLRGPVADAAIVLKQRDAVALATAAFGESLGDDRPLSGIERTVLERSLESIAGAFAPVCGFREVPALEPLHGLAEYTTFFEMQLERPAPARIGVALSQEPAPAPGPCLTPEDLLGLDVELAVTLEGCTIPAESLVDLQPGDFVPITHEKVLTGTLSLAGTVIRRGECGVRAGRYALAVNES
jgi:hypothetical protein